jgi:hypothetical protein
MSEAYSQPRYSGTALPGNAETVVLFSTVTAFPGKSFQAGAGIKRLIIDIKHDQAGTIKAYRSQNRGVTWNQLYDSGSIAAPAATSSTIRDFAFEPYMDFKVEWLNGATPQTTFIVDEALTDERSPLT